MGLLAGIVLSSRPTEAQYTADYQTNIISGVTSNWTGFYVVGSNTFANVLVIVNNGVLSDDFGIVGWGLGNSNNSVVVSDSGSLWSNDTLFFGSFGAGNSMVISNGGRVVDNLALVSNSSSSSNNSVVVTGFGSLWNSGNLRIGAGGTGNRLVVCSGGQVFGSGYLGYGAAASNNSVLVTDSGSIWSNSYLNVGGDGRGNRLVVSNGAQVLNAGAGSVGTSAFSKIGSNTVLVTGGGSVWSNGGDLTVGSYMWGNGVVVNNGGLLINNNGYIGGYPSSSNRMLVSDVGSVWTNLGDVYIGYDQAARNSLTVSNGAKVFSGYGYLGYDFSSSSNNTAVVTGSGSLWTNRNDLYIGRQGGGNSLVILSSGAVYNTVGYIGYDTTAASNSVVIGGTGSVWSTLNGLYVGNSGAGNSLVISNRGRVVTGTPASPGPTDSYMGYNASSSNNNVAISDAGSRWDNSMLLMGYSGPGNSLVVSNGGRVSSDRCYMGYNPSSRNNRILVTDSGSIWSNRDARYVGYSGAGNSLVISNGGQVIDYVAVSAGCFLGYGTGSRINSVLVTGPGSLWSVRTDLYVGYSGAGNSLVISNSAQVVDGDGYVGNGPSGSSNTVRVVGGGIWQNNSLYVGYAGSSNSMVVAGGSVLATNLVIGAASATCDNLVELDSGSVIVTNATHDAVLEVRNGSFIQNGGVVQADILVVTNGCARFIRNGGTLLYSQLVLDPNLSAAGDGIPNGWKQQYGLDPFDPNLGSEDSDGDGMSNLQEYLAGTDPTNSASAFRIIEVRPDDADMLVAWTAVGGKWYVLQTTTGYGGCFSNDFVDLDAASFAFGTGETTMAVLHLGAATNAPARYYRVRLVP